MACHKKILPQIKRKRIRQPLGNFQSVTLIIKGGPSIFNGKISPCNINFVKGVIRLTEVSLGSCNINYTVPYSDGFPSNPKSFIFRHCNPTLINRHCQEVAQFCFTSKRIARRRLKLPCRFLVKR